MDRKEKILSYMCSKEYIPLKFAELMIVLDVPAEDEEELRDILTELCIEGKIYMTKKGRYMSVEGENSTVVGKLVCNAKGFFGFVICDNENESDIFISNDSVQPLRRQVFLLAVQHLNVVCNRVCEVPRQTYLS